MRQRIARSSLIGLLATSGLAESQEWTQTVNGRPDLNGIWQAMNTAHWNLEAHSAERLEEFWAMGALAAIPAGRSWVVGGMIPYLPEALEQREANHAGWPRTDPEAACYLPGIPRATYMPYPFEIVQGDGDLLFVYEYASANRPIHMRAEDHLTYEEVPVDQWMGWSNGSWDGDTLVVQVVAHDSRTWFDRAGNYHTSALTVTERYTRLGQNLMQYEATIDDPVVYSRPWTIRMPLYRRIEPNATLLEFKCVEFAEPLLYGDLLKEPIQ
jgi:hypothetical protein